MNFLEKVKHFATMFGRRFGQKIEDTTQPGRDFCKCARCGSHYSLRKLFGTEKPVYVCRWCYNDTYQMANNQAQVTDEPKVRHRYFGITRKQRRELGRDIAKQFKQRAKVALAAE